MAVAADIGRKLTWEDIKDLFTEGKTELIEGELMMAPTAGPPHQRIGTKLTIEIYPFVAQHGLGDFFGRDMHVVFDAHNHLEPDLCFISKDRLSIVKGAYVEGPPDLVIEILSDSNRSYDIQVKYRLYERYGVGEYWLVDPRDQSISVYVLEQGRYQLLGEFRAGRVVQTRVLEGLELDPARIF
jgi:Uma2 family endonuclease